MISEDSYLGTYLCLKHSEDISNSLGPETSELYVSEASELYVSEASELYVSSMHIFNKLYFKN